MMQKDYYLQKTTRVILTRNKKNLIAYLLLSIGILTMLNNLMRQWKGISISSKTTEAIDQQFTYIPTQTEIDPASWHIQMQENEESLSKFSLFPSSLFLKYSNQLYPAVTAIVNRIDDSDDGIKNIVSHLLKYPFIKEIYIYNQIKSRPINPEELFPNYKRKQVNIKVIETGASLFNMGKFTACAVASYKTCYFQDDLWINTYMDSLYTHSVRYPGHVIANTRPINYLNYVKWRFSNSKINLHTGYSDLRYGAFVPRQKVQTFLSQLSIQSLDMNKLELSEIYFSIWLNQYPYLISNPLLSNGRDGFKNVDSVNNRKSAEYYMYNALSMLEASLISNSTSILIEEDLDYFEKTELSPGLPERDVRSSCSNDYCLFITNISDSIQSPPIDTFTTSTIPNISQYESTFDSLDRTKSLLKSQYYHKAVDGDTETCWNSITAPKANDYFGLYMVGDIHAKRITLYTKTAIKKRLDQVFKVQVQYVMYGSWEDCDITTDTATRPPTPGSSRINFDFKCNNSHQPFKSVRIYFKQDQTKSFKLCGLALDNFIV